MGAAYISGLPKCVYCVIMGSPNVDFLCRVDCLNV